MNKLRLDSVYSIFAQKEKIKRISKLSLEDEDKQELLNIYVNDEDNFLEFNVKDYVEFESHHYLENGVKCYFNEATLKEYYDSLLVNVSSFFDKNFISENLRNDNTLRGFIFKVTEQETDNVLLYFINKVPRKKIDKRNYLMRIGNNTNVIKADNGLALDTQITMIYDKNSNVFYVNSLDSLDFLLNANTGNLEQATKTFEKLVNGDVKLIDKNIKGVKNEYFNELNLRQKKYLAKLDLSKLEEFDRYTSIQELSKRANLSTYQFPNINKDEINIENKAQFLNFFSYISKKIEENLVTQKVKGLFEDIVEGADNEGI